MLGEKMVSFLDDVAKSTMACENVRDRAGVVDSIAKELEDNGHAAKAEELRAMANEWVCQEEGFSALDDLDSGLEQDAASAKRGGLAYWLERLRDFKEGTTVRDDVTQEQMTEAEILEMIEACREDK